MNDVVEWLRREEGREWWLQVHRRYTGPAAGWGPHFATVKDDLELCLCEEHGPEHCHINQSSDIGPVMDYQEFGLTARPDIAAAYREKIEQKRRDRRDSEWGVKD